MKHKFVRTPTLGFIIWPMTDDVYHAHVGAAYCRSGPLLSAGFADIANGKVRCYGFSESLNLESRDDDTQVLAKQLGLESAA